MQVRLLEGGVQAAAPIKDTGNDLIAVKGAEFRAVQVKTCLNARPDIRRDDLPPLYHILALVTLREREGRLLLDESVIHCLTKDEVETEGRIDWGSKVLTSARLATVFAPAI